MGRAIKKRTRHILACHDRGMTMREIRRRLGWSREIIAGAVRRYRKGMNLEPKTMKSLKEDRVRCGIKVGSSLNDLNMTAYNYLFDRAIKERCTMWRAVNNMIEEQLNDNMQGSTTIR